MPRVERRDEACQLIFETGEGEKIHYVYLSTLLEYLVKLDQAEVVQEFLEKMLPKNLEVTQFLAKLLPGMSDVTLTRKNDGTVVCEGWMTAEVNGNQELVLKVCLILGLKGGIVTVNTVSAPTVRSQVFQSLQKDNDVFPVLRMLAEMSSNYPGDKQVLQQPLRSSWYISY